MAFSASMAWGDSRKLSPQQHGIQDKAALRAKRVPISHNYFLALHPAWAGDNQKRNSYCKPIFKLCACVKLTGWRLCTNNHFASSRLCPY